MTGKRRAEPRRRFGRQPRPSGTPSPGTPTPGTPTSGTPTPGPPTPGRPTPGTVIAPVRTRRQLRQERRARRRRIGGWGVAGLAALAAVVAAAIGFGVHTITASNPTPGPSQTTVLLQVAGAGGHSAGAMLLAHDDRTHAGAELLIPSSLITSVCGYGQNTFGALLALPDGARIAAGALSGLLDGARIGGTWTLTEAQLARLVDAVGGVSVDVDANVTRPGPHGTTVVVVPKGAGEHLDGAKAVAYATFQASRTEDAAAQLARFQSVVQAVIDRLPRSPAAVARLITGLGSGAASTLGADRLAGLLLALAADDQRDGGVLATDLPVTKIDTGGAPAYQVDTTHTRQFVTTNLADSLPAHPTPQLTVLVENGTGSAGRVAAACKQLSAAGFAPSDGGSASRPVRTSEVLLNARTLAAAAQGRRVAAALHLPAGDVKVNPVPQQVADVLVILGRDYRP